MSVNRRQAQVAHCSHLRLQRKAAVSLEILNAFMDPQRKIDPTPSPRRT